MQLNDFTGGLNLRLVPHLIGQNEGVVYTNIDTIKGALVPLKDDTKLSMVVKDYIYNFNDTWISTDMPRDYVTFQAKVYYSDGIGIPQKSDDGITFNNLGIKKPSSAPLLSSGTGESPYTFDGVYQYCYTYYNSIDGTESQPSKFSIALTMLTDIIEVTVLASIDTQVDSIRIYRLGGNITSMSLVETIDNLSQTYEDSIGDLDIDSRVLASYNNAQAPEGLTNLFEANAMLFGSVDNTLWFSEIAYTNYWSEFNFIDFESEITGIGNTANGLLVFTEFKTYIITGTAPSELSKYLLDASQGCLSQKSINFAKGTLAWASSDGICISNGSSIEVISRSKLGTLNITNIKYSIVHDDIYYISYEDKLLSIDFRFGSIFSYLDISTTCLHNYKDVVYYSKDGYLYTLGTSNSYKTMEFTSGIYSDSSITNLKNYKSIYINSTGNLVIKTYINEVLINTTTLLGGVEEIKIDQAKRLGYNIRFNIVGTGIINEIQYSVEGRQNGK